MFQRSSSGGSLSLRDLADDFFSQPPQTKMNSSYSSLGRSNHHLSRRKSTGHIISDYPFVFDKAFEVPLAPPSSSRTADDFVSSLHSFSALLRKSAEMRLSQNHKENEDSSNINDFFGEPSPNDVRSNNTDAVHRPTPETEIKSSLTKSEDDHGKRDKSPKSSKSSLKPKTSRRSNSPADVRTKRNGFFGIPSPPFLISPDDDVHSNKIGAVYRPAPTIKLNQPKNHQDEHDKSDKSLRSSKSRQQTKAPRRKSSPADISHSHKAPEKRRSTRRNSIHIQQTKDDTKQNPYDVNERQRPLRRVSSFSVGNAKLNQKGRERPSSSIEGKEAKTILKEAAVLHSNTSENTKRSYPSTSHVKKYLQHYADALRLPAGFITSIIKAYKSTDSRLWLMENTSSMKIRDSHRAKIDANLKHIQRDDGHSRWTELSQTVDFHVKMSARCFIPTKFWLMNDPGSSVEPKRFSVAWGNHDDVKTERTIALDMMKRVRLDTDQNHLTRQLRKIEKRVREDAPRLIAANKVVTVVLCTQGRQTDEYGNEGSAVMKDCVDSLKALSKLPVKIVVRLCADDEKALEFVSKIDVKLDSVVILGDYWREATEVNLHNPWLTYGLGIHRLREACLTPELLNNLGRKVFTADDIYEFCKEFFIGEKEIYLPHPRNSLDAFLRAINHLLEDEKNQWNPVRKKLTPWIDMKELERQCRSHL